MTFYESNPEVRPTGAEPEEFLDAPPRGPVGPGTGTDPPAGSERRGAPGDVTMGTAGHGARRRTATGRVERRESYLRIAAGVVGAMFLLVGLLGFVPGVTTNVGSMHFAGAGSPSQLFGVFEVSVLHNGVHLLFGIAGLAAARRSRTAFLYLVTGGAVYLALALFGVVVEHGSAANFVPVDEADNWLHLGLGVGMIALGLAGKPLSVDARLEAATARE